LLVVSTAIADESVPPSELAGLLGSDANPGFARADRPRAFTFPADHGPHPEFRNEWWYFTGNLDSDTGKRFGFELTFFRFALTPALQPSESAWRTNQVFIAHLAVTDADGERFLVAQRYSRGAVGLAGAETGPLRVWIDDWQISASSGEDSWQLDATDEEFQIDLTVTALKSPVRQTRETRPITTPSLDSGRMERSVSDNASTRCVGCPGSIANGVPAPLPLTRSAGTGLRCNSMTAAS
jgi:predicted secreted hydrolase